MENTSKPQWLIEAEQEIKKFHETDAGKLTDKQFKRKEAASYAASCISQESRSKGGKNGSKEHKQKANAAQSFEGKSKGGKNGGAKNVESGHWEKLVAMKPNRFRKDTKTCGSMTGNLLFVFSNGAVIKNPAGRDSYINRNPDVSMIRKIHQSEEDYAHYESIALQQDKQSNICKWCNQPFHKKRVRQHEDRCKHKPA